MSPPSRLLRVISRRVEGEVSWNELLVDCPRRGRIGLELCVECPLFTGLALRGARCKPFARCAYRKPTPL